MEMDRTDLRRAAEFAGAAIAARSAADVDALVRRVRHVVRADDVRVQRIAAATVTEWHDPEAGTSAAVGTGHDERRLTMCELTSFGSVRLSARRLHDAFGPRDQALLSLIAPYLTAAVAAVRADDGGSPGSVAAGAGADAELTGREAEVLAHIAGGATNKEVAHDLDISPRTVQKHLEHIYDKLGLHRRTAAAGWWAQHLAAG